MMMGMNEFATGALFVTTLFRQLLSQKSERSCVSLLNLIIWKRLFIKNIIQNFSKEQILTLFLKKYTYEEKNMSIRTFYYYIFFSTKGTS